MEIEKSSKLSHDGKQLITRIPNKIQEEGNFEKGDMLKWKAKGNKLKVELIKQVSSKSNKTKGDEDGKN